MIKKEINFIKFFFKELKQEINKARADILKKEKQSKFVFDDNINNENILLLKEDNFFIGIDKKGLFKCNKDQSDKTYDLDNMSEDIKNDVNNFIKKIYNTYRDELYTSKKQSEIIDCDNYKDYFKELTSALTSVENKNVSIQPNDKKLSRLSSTLGIKVMGEDYGLKNYSNISISMTISMDLPIENIDDFSSFSTNVILHQINKISKNIKNNNINL